MCMGNTWILSVQIPRILDLISSITFPSETYFQTDQSEISTKFFWIFFLHIVTDVRIAIVCSMILFEERFFANLEDTRIDRCMYTVKTRRY